jgi:hypothetical protein
MISAKYDQCKQFTVLASLQKRLRFQYFFEKISVETGFSERYGLSKYEKLVKKKHFTEHSLKKAKSNILFGR